MATSLVRGLLTQDDGVCACENIYFRSRLIMLNRSRLLLAAIGCMHYRLEHILLDWHLGLLDTCPHSPNQLIPSGHGSALVAKHNTYNYTSMCCYLTIVLVVFALGHAF